jgi:hypothetical protein
MREVFADFSVIEPRPEYGLSDDAIVLGTERRRPELAELRDGERLLLVEWGELCAEASVTYRDINGERYWFGHELGKIRDLSTAAR